MCMDHGGATEEFKFYSCIRFKVNGMSNCVTYEHIHSLHTLPSTHPQVMLSIVKQEPHFAVSVGEKHLLQGDHILVLQLTQQLYKLRLQNLVLILTSVTPATIIILDSHQSPCRLTLRCLFLRSASEHSHEHQL